MADLLHIATGEKAYEIQVNRTACWLKGRKPHLVEKNLRTEASRFMAALCAAGVSFDDAKGRSGEFAHAVATRLFELTEAERRPACTVVQLRRNAA